MVKKAPKNGEKGPKSDKKFSGRVRAGSNLLFSGPGRVRATAKSPGPVRAGVDHRPLLVTVNWRTKTVTEMSLDGRTIGGFSHDELIEPIAVAVTPDDNILIADNGVGAVLVFESSGKLKRRIGSKGKKAGQFKELGGVCLGPAGEVVVADTRILVFSAAGEFLRELGGGKGGRYCGVQVAGDLVLAARMEKGGGTVQVLSLATGELVTTIDSHGARLKRPTGLAVSREQGSVWVVDIGHDCVRKYRYK